MITNAVADHKFNKNFLFIIYTGVSFRILHIKFTPVYIVKTGSILKDFLIFEKTYFHSEKWENNNFYVLLYTTDAELFIQENFNKNILAKTTLDRRFKEETKELTKLLNSLKIDFLIFQNFKCVEDLLYSYMLLFLLKAFSLKVKKQNQDLAPYNLSIKDFIFERNDFVNIFVDYLYKFFIFNEIQNKIFFNKNKDFLRNWTMRLVTLWSDDGLFTIKDLIENFRHLKVLRFSIFNIQYCPETIIFVESFNKHIRSQNEIYLYNSHFSSIMLMNKEATYSSATFKAPSEQVEVILQRNVYLDRELLIKSYKLLLEEKNLTGGKDLDKIYHTYTSKILKFIEEKDLTSLATYQSKLSDIHTLLRIRAVLELTFDNKKLYLPFMFCFRGRIYELGNLSFTFYKEFRFCMYSGEYSSEEEEFHPINSQTNGIVDEQFHLFKKYKWFEQMPLIRKRTCIWIFISLGVMKKNELGAKVHISAFLIKGQEMWENQTLDISFENIFEKIEFRYLTFLIEELKTKITLKKWIFWKDATASCFQHLVMVLGPRDENSYKICNLNSTEYWYDPYTYLITDFFLKEKEKKKEIEINLLLNEPKFFIIFSRSRLKKVIMTETYGAGLTTLTSYFTLNLNWEKFTLEEREEISQIWNKFFNYLSNENVLLSQSSKTIIDYFLKNSIQKVVNPDNSEVDYSCYAIYNTQKEFYVQKKRHTYNTKCLTTKFDKSQFKISLRANFIQSRDAILARQYIKYTKMWTIHDCFAIDFLNITYMTSVVNQLMNGDFYELKLSPTEKKPIYSIFIII